jgi:signal transduction histidine kinase
MTNHDDIPSQSSIDARNEISFLIDRSLAHTEVEDAAIAVIDKALGHPPRISFPSGSTIIREGEAVDGIFLRLNGRVTLSRRIDDEERVFHARTAGRVLGLMSLAEGNRAFFTCRAALDTELIHITYEQLDQGLRSSPEVAAQFSTLLLRSLSRRNQRAIELQIDINRLNNRLASERDQLSSTLTQLEKAQMRIVESEKMATLGQLVAGIGHEMNNPVAAINRAASFLADDLRALAAEHPDHDVFLELMENALRGTAKSTREQRAQIADLTARVHNPELARRLVKIDITGSEDLPERLQSLSPEEILAQMDTLERFYNVGSSLRNIQSCSSRISRLIAGLRSYARAGKQVEDDVNIAEELDETLLIFGNALRKVTLEKVYKPVPLITCQPGEINQVWTNLISNALQAMNDQGTLRVELDAEDDDFIVVRIIDSGSGIAPENLGRIFELNFTTRQGRVDFGLGMGLAICKDIVHRHDGTIEAESKPGRTVFTVRLPVKSTVSIKKSPVGDETS